MPSSVEMRQSFKEKPTNSTLVMYQRWEELLFLHWRIEPDVIQATLPKGLYVDTFEGDAFVGVVPFFMEAVRPRFLPAVPHISYFQELNVRTYVYDENGLPAVWFYSLDANRRLAVTLAQTFFHLPYKLSKMHAKRNETAEGWVEYTSQRVGTSEQAFFKYRGIGDFASPDPMSLASFLVDRYWLIAHNPHTDTLFRGRVWHEPYRIRNAETTYWSDLPHQCNGFPSFLRPPDHICHADNLDVQIYGIEKSSSF